MNTGNQEAQTTPEVTPEATPSMDTGSDQGGKSTGSIVGAIIVVIIIILGGFYFWGQKLDTNDVDLAEEAATEEVADLEADLADVDQVAADLEADLAAIEDELSQ